MWIAYVDESGDSGELGSLTYTLGCVLVRDGEWPDTFDGLLGFRRSIKRNFGIKMHDEIKANSLVRGSGDLSNFSFGDRIRHDIYRMHMRACDKLGLKVFAVVIRKRSIRVWRNPRDIAWEFLLQRVERLQETVLIMHDEGDDLAIRTLVRKARRISMPGSAFGLNQLKLPVRLIVDDAVPRRSNESYFIQLADLSAYAAFRSLYPPPSSKRTVCPGIMWDALGDARRAETNSLARSTGRSDAPLGVAVWP